MSSLRKYGILSSTFNDTAGDEQSWNSISLNYILENFKRELEIIESGQNFENERDKKI